MLNIEPNDISRLNAEQLVSLLSKLLTIEAKRLSIPLADVHVPTNINAPDGGEDGRITLPPGATSDYLFSGINLFQAKATKMDNNKCAKEVQTANKEIKPNVKEVLDLGGTYILFCTELLVKGNVTRTNDRVKYKLSIMV